jgi:hypothetical protein
MNFELTATEIGVLLSDLEKIDRSADSLGVPIR